MDRRLDELRGQRIVEAIETAVGQPLPETQRHDLVRGADELDLVRSGLDDTMRQAYNEMREVLFAVVTRCRTYARRRTSWRSRRSRRAIGRWCTDGTSALARSYRLARQHGLFLT